MTKIAISDQYEIHPVVRITLFGVTTLLALATLVTAGSSLGAKFGILASTSCTITFCLTVVPSLKLWRRVEQDLAAGAPEAANREE
ncbi:hypothetical protein PZT57_26445 [Pseudomonas aeruginosa]|uniref:hypothetical protein n=1 Tax=Pseudomonas aeruginosa TaxID=287 RepID=UPI002B26ADAB|nr:hypothetical protein [Pseudomonas aeruginosa]MEA8592189.1 hypothetical protein [Pseudomonas aeruginosa]